MTFQIHPLKDDFADLFDLSDAELKARRAQRVIADKAVGFPCRVTLEDAEIGDEVILVNHAHMTKSSPYYASHAIYVRKDAAPKTPPAGDIPAMLARRTLSVRGFDNEGFIREAAIVEGTALGPQLDAIFANPEIEFADLHFAQRGCFAARATRT